jgi:hypothetical protein
VQVRRETIDDLWEMAVELETSVESMASEQVRDRFLSYLQARQNGTDEQIDDAARELKNEIHRETAVYRQHREARHAPGLSIVISLGVILRILILPPPPYPS